MSVKVLNVNHLIDPVTGGGTAERTFQMCRFLIKAGVDCTLLTLDIGITRQRLESLAGVNIVSCPPLHERFFLPRCSFGLIRKLVADADIVHLMGHWTALNALVYLAARMAGKPYAVCPAGALPVYGRSAILKRIYNLLIGRKIIAHADMHIAITRDEIPQFEAYGVTADKVSVIPNGIDQTQFLSKDNQGFRNRYGLGSTPYILFMGRLNQIKGPDLLLQAFCNLHERLQGYHLLFAGPDGGMRATLEASAATGNMTDRVHFTGYLGDGDKSQAYHAADFLVIPSRQEAMSIVVLESGACATPVLLTDRCGFDEVGAVNGGKVVPVSVAGLEQGMLEMLSDRQKLDAMGENLQRFVLEHFAWEALINTYLRLYRDLRAAGENRDAAGTSMRHS